MNNRLKILIIFILTLIITVGGGYLYYTQLTKIQKMDEEYLTEVHYREPVVIPGVNLGNVNPKKVRRNSKDNEPLIVPDAGRKLPSEGTVGDIETSSTGRLTGFGGHTYPKRTIESNNGGGSGAGGGNMLAYSGSSRSGGSSSAGGYSSGGTMMGGTAPVMAPRIPTTSPPTVGTGTILVDPMNDPLESERVPVGDGLWILIALALGYSIKSRKQK